MPVKANKLLPRHIDSLKQQLLQPLPDSNKAIIYSDLAWELKTGNPDIAMLYIDSSLSIVESKKTKAVLWNTKGVIYQLKGEYHQALFYHLNALRIYQELNNTRYQSRCMGNIGVLYGNIKKKDISKKYLLEALHLEEKEKQPDYNMLIVCYINLGESETDSVQQKFLWYKKAIELGIKHNLKKHSIPAYINLSQAYLDNDNVQLAEYYCMEALKTGATSDNYYHRACINILGEVALVGNKAKKALAYFTEAKQLLGETGTRTDRANQYKLISQAYNAQHNYKAAFHYSNLYHSLKDSVLNEETFKQINDLQLKYEVEKKDKDIQILHKDKEIIEAKMAKGQLFRNSFIAGLIGLLIIIFIIARNVVLKQRVKARILREEKMLMEKDNEKLLHENTIAKYEIFKSKTDPHFLFNNLNTLSSIVLKNPLAAVEYIEQFSLLYRTILKTEKQLVVSLHEEMQLVKNYLYLQKIQFEDKLVIDIPAITDAYSYFVPPFSVQMCVENAIKHNIITNTRKLKITIAVDKDSITITNNLQKRDMDVVSTSTGQNSIRDRYGLLTDIQPLFTETAGTYVAQLPLLELKDTAKLQEELGFINESVKP